MRLGQVDHPDNTNKVFLRESLLEPYVSSDTEVYKCPDDRAMSINGGRRYPHVRSVGMNCFLASHCIERDIPYRVHFKLSEIERPSKHFVSLDERADTLDSNMFNVGHEGIDPVDPTLNRWTELPANYHGNSATFSFADGHSEVHKWTRPMPPMSAEYIPAQWDYRFPISPSNPDIIWLFKRSTTRK
jgi:prepilin-type processing-associated H-X9-DG protein